MMNQAKNKSEPWAAFLARQANQGGGGCLPGSWTEIEQAQKQAWNLLADRLLPGSKVLDLATGDGLAGDLLLDPGVELPGGATLLCRGPKQESLFVGLIAGTAEVDRGPTSGRYYVFAGVDRVREMLAIPTDYPVDMVPKFRPDGITVLEPAAPAEPPPPPTPQPVGGGQR